MLPMTEAMHQLRTARTKPWAICSRWTLANGDILRFTNHDTTLAAATDLDDLSALETFSPAAGPNGESWRKVAGLEPLSTSFKGAMVLPTVTTEAFRVGLFRRAQVDTFAVNWRWPWQGFFEHQRVWVREWSWSGESWDVVFESIPGLMDRNIGRIYSRHCDAEFGDARCGANAVLFTENGTVAAVDALNPRTDFESDLTTEADKYYDHGKLVWLTGNNAIAGLDTYTVRKHRQSDGTFSLFTETPFDVEIGDTFAVTAGCNKLRKSHCLDKFSLSDATQVERFRGFPWMPASDKIIKSPNLSKK